MKARRMNVSLRAWRIACALLAAFHVLSCGLASAADAPVKPGTSAASTEEGIDLAVDGLTVRGTLRMPAAPHRPPVVLIVAGSGPTDRDGNSNQGLHTDDLKQIAEGLAERGIASVRYDKRGIAASDKVAESALRFDTYVGDARAWVDKLRASGRFGAVAMLGHSEGGLIALVVANRAKVDAVVVASTPAERASDLLRQQLATKLPPDLLRRNEEILTALERGQTVADVPAVLAPLYRPSVQGYLTSWFQVDPMAQARSLRVPLLVVQGTRDLQVPDGDAHRLASATPMAHLLEIGGMNHVLKQVDASDDLQRASYTDPAVPLGTGMVDAVAKFIHDQKALSPQGA